MSGSSPRIDSRDLERDLGVRDPVIADAVRDLCDRADDDRVGLAQEIDDVLLHEGERHRVRPGERDPCDGHESETRAPHRLLHSFLPGHGHAFPEAAISASRDPTCEGSRSRSCRCRHSSRRAASTRIPGRRREAAVVERRHREIVGEAVGRRGAEVSAARLEHLQAAAHDVVAGRGRNRRPRQPRRVARGLRRRHRGRASRSHGVVHRTVAVVIDPVRMFRFRDSRARSCRSGRR